MKIITSHSSHHQKLATKLDSERANILEWLIQGTLRWIGESKENGSGANVDAQHVAIIGK
jgi:phage/plasmid-associated DNA primase